MHIYIDMHIIYMIVGGEDGGDERRWRLMCVHERRWRLMCVHERRWRRTESWTWSESDTSTDTTRPHLHLHLTPRATSSIPLLRQYVYCRTSKASQVST